MTATHLPPPEELMAYLDGELPAAQARDVQAHLASCERCQAIAGDLRHVSSEMRVWQAGETPASLRLPERSAPTAVVPRPNWAFLRSRAMIVATPVLAGAVLILIVALPTRFRVRQAGADVVMPEARNAAAFESASSRSSRMGQGGATTSAASRPQELVAQDHRSSQPADRPSGPLIVRTAQLRIVATDFANARAAIDRIIKDVNGFAGQITASGAGEAPRSIQATLRVPAARFDAAIAAARGLGRVMHESQESDDVTEQSIDLDARLGNARTTEKRLLDLLANRTGRMSDVLEMERELSRVRTEIERLAAQRHNLDRRVEYASLTLEVLEERAPSVSLGPIPLPTQLKQAIVDGLEAAASSLIGLTLFLFRVGPALLLWAALVGLPAWWIAQRQRRVQLRA